MYAVERGQVALPRRQQDDGLWVEDRHLFLALCQREQFGGNVHEAAGRGGDLRLAL